MKLARYVGQGRVEIVEEPEPRLPSGGLIVQTEACGLCSGELMDWYMDAKLPHVLGHEVAGVVVESDDARFPVGARVAPHHHAPCMRCALCARGAYVHCSQWKCTKLTPGGMAERFAVSAENLSDTLIVNHLEPEDAALIEPIGCVMKSISRALVQPSGSVAIVGLGFMGLAHMLLVEGSVGYELNYVRRDYARSLGLDAREPLKDAEYETVFVMPGTQPAIEFGLELAAPDATVVLFAPTAPEQRTALDLSEIYFRDLKVVMSYSCGSVDTAAAAKALTDGRICAQKLVSDRVSLEGLPQAYLQMKRGEILKPMVVFS